MRSYLRKLIKISVELLVFAAGVAALLIPAQWLGKTWGMLFLAALLLGVVLVLAAVRKDK